MAYFDQSIAQTISSLKTHKSKGLSLIEVKKRVSAHGENILPRGSNKVSVLKIFIQQWLSPLILILVGAGIVSGLLHEFVDMTIIFITASINAFIGFFQENKANRALEKLQSYISYNALVIRNGMQIELPSKDIVPGDILLLQAGDKVQADGRIISSNNFSTNEAPLTGESVPIDKQSKPMKKDTQIADQTNMVFRGTTVSSGEARIVITATGKDTELGKIALLVKNTKEDPTPLQLQLQRLGNMLGLVILAIAFGIFAIGMLGTGEKYGMFELFETAVAVAVAAIPEGLVISLTVILAIGMQHILKKKALVRKLLAAETLGSVSVICTDKTGTLTQGKMQVTHIFTGSRPTPIGQIIANTDVTAFVQQRTAVRIATLANDAKTIQNSLGEEYIVGGMTEVAIIHAANTLDIEKGVLDRQNKRLTSIPFDSAKKYMATLHAMPDGKEIFVKGAPEVVLSRSSQTDDGTISNMSDKTRDLWLKRAEKLARTGHRTLAVAYKRGGGGSTLKDSDIKELIFVGLLSIADPVREDVKETIKLAKEAGIRIIMMTGDHRSTAQAIAVEVGLRVKANQVCDGAALHECTEEELEKKIKHTQVFARVNPADKIRIVRALQAQGHVVAMTGDGVNDAPALKGADIGVAVGSGTEVAKETADMVLLEDSFSTIVSAVEEGRRIYQNIKKVVLYLLSGSFAEVILIGGSLLAGLPLAVLPAQILWVNIIEDTFPTMALAFDKGEKENMKDPPRGKKSRLVDYEMKTMIIIISVVSNLVLFGMFLYYWKSTGDIALTRTIMFAGLGVDSLLYIYSVRSMRKMIWQTDLFSNKMLTGALLFGWVMLIVAVYAPPLQYLLRTVSLSLQHWFVLISFGLLNVCLIELVKGIFLFRKKTI